MIRHARFSFLAAACALVSLLRPALLRAEDAALTARDDGKSVRVAVGGRLLLEYPYKDVAKPYVKQLCSPSGVNPLRDNVADHIHHRGLMFAVAVDKVSFWMEDKRSGREVSQKPAGVRSAEHNGTATAGFDEELQWLAADKRLVAREKRSLQLAAAPGRPTLLTWRSRLEPPPGAASVTLTGDHYYGLGMRLLASMDGGQFLYASGQPGMVVRGDERNTPSAWCAITGPADGKVVTVALFDHPANPRHPAVMFTMARPFAYQSATLNLWKQPMKVSADAPLDLRYGVAVWDGKIERAEIERAYEEWKKKDE